MTTQQNNPEEQTPAKKEPKKSTLLFSLTGYLLSIIILAVAIYWGNIQLDIGIAAAKSEALDRDNATFVGIFIFLAGGLISASTALSVFVIARNKRGEH